MHDPDRPAPKRVDPGKAGEPAAIPADAVVLFDGKDLSRWEGGQDWKLESGCLVAGEGAYATKEQFGDSQYHLEWQLPAHFEGPWYNRGNNGVLLMGLFEIQIFDSLSDIS